MEVFVAETGFCWGIDLAYQRMDKFAADHDSTKATHRGGADARWDTVQRIAVDEILKEKYPGLRKVEVVDNIETIMPGAATAIGHQGLADERIEAAKRRGVEIVDYKCPFIARFDKVARTLAFNGYDLIAFGKPKNHHCHYATEVAAQAGRSAVVAEDVAAIERELKQPNRNWACVAQVTGNGETWDRFRAELKGLGIPVHVVDTICTDSRDRQAEAVTLASRADLAIVVDDGGGATVSVFEVVQAVNPNSFRHDPDKPLPLERFKDVKSVAVLCGILVPKWVLDRVAADVAAIGA